MKRKLTEQQENQVRRQFFKERIDPEALIKNWSISHSTLRKIVGGPLKVTKTAIENVYC